MKIEELNERIEKKEQQIKKIEKRIEKWSKGMPNEAKEICANCELTHEDPNFREARENYLDYKRINLPEKEDLLFNPDDFNKGPNYDQLYQAYRDLADNKQTLNKYKVALDKEINYNNETKIETIWNFLLKVKEANYNYFIENAKEYKTLRDNVYQEEQAYKETIKDLLSNRETYMIGWRKLRNWEIRYYENIHPLTKQLFDQGELDLQKLNDELDKDIKNKYQNLVQTITKKAGQIKDASNLFVAENGSLNGYIVGDKNTVEVETISAGGYNIQCFHFRTLVRIVNK